EGVTELAALMNRPRGLRRNVARDSARERELREEACHPGRVLCDFGIHLAVGALEPGGCDRAGPTVAGTHHIDHVEVALTDASVQMRVDEVQAGRRAPVAEQAGLDVL